MMISNCILLYLLLDFNFLFVDILKKILKCIYNLQAHAAKINDIIQFSNTVFCKNFQFYYINCRAII